MGRLVVMDIEYCKLTIQKWKNSYSWKALEDVEREGRMLDGKEALEIGKYGMSLN